MDTSSDQSLESNFQSTMATRLRAELEQELKCKRRCAYPSYECTQMSIDGYKFCSKHILQDKTAPFKQCTFIYTNSGKRCTLPAPRSDKKEYGYCSEHALKASMSRNKHNTKSSLPDTPEGVLSTLTHYLKRPGQRSMDENLLSDDGVDGGKMTKSNDPFVDLDVANICSERCNEILDHCSESESDIEPANIGLLWHDCQIDSSDDESIDSDHEDPLKHANVYTAEEITSITKEKLVKLQTLYVEQYRHLQYLLKEKRRKYLLAVRKEKETCCSIHNQIRDDPREQRLYKKLKALNNYHQHHGVHAVFQKRLRDLRDKIIDGIPPKISSSSKCIFTEGGVKCGEKVLLFSKYCPKHILEDPNQVLFKQCGKLTGDVECVTPIAAIFEDATCPLHMDVPTLKSYNLIRKDSESDVDEYGDHPTMEHYSAQLSDASKTEFMNYIPPEIPKMETVPSLLFEESSQSVSGSTLSQNEDGFVNEENCNMETAIKEEGIGQEKSVECNSTFEDSQIKSDDVQKFEAEESSSEVFCGFEETDIPTDSFEALNKEILKNKEKDNNKERESMSKNSEDETVKMDVDFNIENN